jgi:hypothetical protein
MSFSKRRGFSLRIFSPDGSPDGLRMVKKCRLRGSDCQEKRLFFVQNYEFPSPSTAARVVLGRSANDRTEWQTSDGRTLKKLQEITAHA